MNPTLSKCGNVLVCQVGAAPGIRITHAAKDSWEWDGMIYTSAELIARCQADPRANILSTVTRFMQGYSPEMSEEWAAALWVACGEPDQ